MEHDKEHQLNQLGENLRKEYKEVIVDFIIYDEDAGKILVQKRSLTRNVFPGAWEFPGGHLEPNESLVNCVRRLVYEEAQMHLKAVVDTVHVFTWDSDKDVVNIQCMVEASGTFVPNKDKITEHRFINASDMDLLLEKGRESQIYRGAYYAFEYVKMLQSESTDAFASILFFDQIVTGFLGFLRSDATAPKVVLGREQDKKFTLDKEQGILSIAPSFLRHYDNLGCASIIMHLMFHNYRQNILAFDDVKAIRSLMGKNVMFYVDIVADAYTFLFLQRFYGFTPHDYLLMCYRLLQEYQGESLDVSKFTRLVGSALTIANREGQGFDVYLPVLDEQDGKLHVLQFSKSLTYQAVALDKTLRRKCTDLVVKPSITEKDFVDTIGKLIISVKAGK